MLERARLSFDPNRLVQGLRFGDRGRTDRRLPPRDLQREFGVIDDASVAAVTAQVVIRAHEDAIDGTGLDAQRAEHALRVIDREPVEPKSLADRRLLLVDVNAIDGTGDRALVATD